MISLAKKRFSFILALIVFALVFSGSSVLAASTFFELRAEIDALLLQLQTPTPLVLADCVVPTAPLTVGSRGGEVKKLQEWLNAKDYPVALTGIGSPGKEGDYFGALTRAAVAKFQSAVGIRPATGFYGPITMSVVRERCTTEQTKNVGLKMSLSESTPKAEVVARGATHVPVLSIDVSGPSVLHSLTLHHYGVGPASGFSRVYLYDGDVRLTSGSFIDNKTDEVTFLDINLAVNGTKTLTVVADFSRANSGNDDGFEIVSAASVGSDGVVVGSFPIQGSKFARVDIAVGSLTVERSGTLISPIIGSLAAKIAEFRITPGLREDSVLHSVTLKNAGSINPALISNFVLKQAGVVVSTASAINARGQIIFTLTKPFTLMKEVSTLFELYADISASASAGDSLRIYLENSIDLYAVGTVSLSGVVVDSAAYDNSASNGSDASWVSISGGAVTLVFQGPSVINYAASQNDIELMRFEVSARDSIEVRETRFMLTAGGPDASSDLLTAGGLCNFVAANYTDIKLVDVSTGAVLTRAFHSACTTGDQDTNRALVYSDYWTVGAGQTRVIKLVADVSKFIPASGETIKATLVAFRDGDIKNTDTSLFIPASQIAPPGNITGATHNVYASPLVAALASNQSPDPVLSSN